MAGSLPVGAQEAITIGPLSVPASLGPADPAEPIAFDLVLAARDPRASSRYAADLHDPASPDFRHYLTPEQIGERFGPTDETLARVTGVVEDAGLRVVSVPPQRTRVSVTGPAATVGAFLGVPIERWQDPRSGAVYHAAAGDPVVPSSIAGPVTAVSGLSPWIPVPAIDPSDAPPPPARGLKPADLALAYDFQSLWDAGIDGSGVSVGILQFGVDTDEDLAVFDATFGIDGPLPIRVPIAGGVADAPTKFATEATLDTQVLRAVAPGAQIIVYGFPATMGWGAAMDAIVEDGRVQLVSLSYGQCYAGGFVGLDEVLDTQRALEAATQAGVSLFAASGDWGAFSCHAFDKTDHRQSTFFPSCTNNVVSVGGTNLALNDDGSYRSEAGWEDYLATGGSGGGLAVISGPDGPLESTPDYQLDFIPEADRASGGRACPDVAASADDDTGYLLFETDAESGDPGWKMVGGTSAAAPFWTGVMTLIQQKAQAQGIERLGFLAPLLYQIAGTHPEAFHDVTRGGNLHDDSGTGWDYATGLGSPVVSVLADAVIEALGGTGQ